MLNLTCLAFLDMLKPMYYITCWNITKMSTNMSLLTQLCNFLRAPLGNLDTPVDEYEDDEEDDDEDY